MTELEREQIGGMRMLGTVMVWAAVCVLALLAAWGVA